MYPYVYDAGGTEMQINLSAVEAVYYQPQKIVLVMSVGGNIELADDEHGTLKHAFIAAFHEMGHPKTSLDIRRINVSPART